MNPHYIENLSLQSLRKFILDNNLKEQVIGLNQVDMDELAEEHRETYGIALEEPFYMEETLIEENVTVPRGRILIGKNNYRPPIKIVSFLPSTDYSKEVVHRCGWCGSVVDYDGKELEPSVRELKIELLEKHIRKISVGYVEGACCHYKRLAI